ncbi:hypothetical protein CCB80_00305 [Armatimonadetes bacterium Uphvl-Ar1]|nr:hypothetical protein CCB80_00305 [Armatimonadetes bacterium Uphvl-Ar1]
MEPTTIIILGIIAGILLFSILLLIPKAREYQAKLEKERAAVESALKSQGLRIEKQEKGDIKWIAHGQDFTLTYNSDLSSESSTPTLSWESKINTPTDNQFILISDSAHKVFTDKFARKILDKLESFAQRMTKKYDAQTARETLTIIDRNNITQIAASKHHKYLLATYSAQKLGNLSHSHLAIAASSLFSLETHAPQVGENRISHLTHKSTVTFYCQEPTVEQIKSIIHLGETIRKLAS